MLYRRMRPVNLKLRDLGYAPYVLNGKYIDLVFLAATDRRVKRSDVAPHFYNGAKLWALDP